MFERGVTEEGEPLVGIRYLSRLGDDIENWAIFEGTEPYDKRSEEIARDDPDLAGGPADARSRDGRAELSLNRRG